MALINIPHNLTFPFVKNKWTPIALFVVFSILVAISVLLKGINYGIDFNGGVVIEASLNGKTVMDDIRAKLKNALPGQEIGIQEISSDHTVIIKTERLSDSDKSEESVNPIKNALGDSVTYKKIEFIGPKVGEELIMNGLRAIGWALLAIMAFVWVRFKWQFGICAILALAHDCIGIVGYFALSQQEFNEGAIVAILITASYSINDTVIIFDRIRENFVFKKGASFKEILNSSVNETLPRTLLTSTTTLLALLMLYLFGGSIISAFSMPIFVGIFIGSYSSIFIAAPLLLFFPSIAQKAKA